MKLDILFTHNTYTHQYRHPLNEDPNYTRTYYAHKCARDIILVIIFSFPVECDDLINKNTKSQKKIHKCIVRQKKNIKKKYTYTQQHTSAREMTMRSDFFIKTTKQTLLLHKKPIQHYIHTHTIMNYK